MENIRTVSNYAKRELEKKQKLVLNFNRRQKIKPVMKWGQNFTHALVYVKFAHRFDSPGCIDNWGTQVNFTDTSIRLNSLGIQGDMPIEFDSEVSLFDGIVPEESTYLTESVGTMVIKLKKAENNKIWRNLLSPSSDKSQYHLKLWWELAEIYEEPMKKYNRLVEAEEDEKDRVLQLFNFSKIGGRKKIRERKRKSQRKRRMDGLTG